MLTARLALYRCVIVASFIVACNTPAPSSDTSTADKPVSKQEPKVLQIFAAAGTRAPIEEICNRFEKDNGMKIERNYASSGTLARQIAEGASVDVFVSANREWVDFLIEKHLLRADKVSKIAGNTLVLIAPKNSTASPPTFSADFDIAAAVPEKIAVGDPAFVPVGKYTKAAFEALGWMDKLKDKMILAKDVSSVLRYTALGESDFGVVYRSEALQSKEVRIVVEVPQSLYDSIAFYSAPISTQSKQAAPLAAAIQSEAGRSVFLKFGFTNSSNDRPE